MKSATSTEGNAMLLLELDPTHYRRVDADDAHWSMETWESPHFPGEQFNCNPIPRVNQAHCDDEPE